MKRIIVMLTALMLLMGQAQAQEFSARGGFQLLLLPAVNFALEYNEETWGVGTRVSATYLVLFLRFQANAYVIVPLIYDWQLYIGGGYARSYFFLGKPTDELHGLIGIRLKQGFFVEATGGLAYGESCVPPVPPVNAAQARTTPCGSYVPTRYFIAQVNLGFSWKF